MITIALVYILLGLSNTIAVHFVLPNCTMTLFEWIISTTIWPILFVGICWYCWSRRK